MVFGCRDVTIVGGHSDKLTSGVKYEGKLQETEDIGLCQDSISLLIVLGDGFWVTRRSILQGM